MEHRCGARCAVRYPVLLATGAHAPPVQALTRNLAPGGALLGDLSRPLGRHQQVELIVHTPRAPLTHWRWPAMVLRADAGGVALMFDTLYLDDFPQLLAAMRTAELNWRWTPVRPLPLAVPQATHPPAWPGCEAAPPDGWRQASQ